MDFSSVISHFNAVLSKHLPLIDDGSDVGKAALWALEGGKRLRPALMYFIQDALGAKTPIDKAALALEMIHTSSLIADDLPSMDNDAMRRGRASTHIQFSESTAYLASYRLIALGYHMLSLCGCDLVSLFPTDGQKRHLKALELLCVKSMEMSTGQFYDLQKEKSVTQKELMRLKTASLFQATFTIAWLLCGGAMEKIDLVNEAGLYFGLAFQLADDLSDAQEDQIHGSANWTSAYSEASAIEEFDSAMKKTERHLDALGLMNQHFKDLLDTLYKSVSCNSSLVS